MRKATSLLVGLSLASACSFFVDDDHLVGGAGGAPLDAADVSPTPPTDAASSTDRGDGNAQATKTWCALNRPGATYCADFDDGRPLSALGITVGALAIAPTEGVASSAALEVLLPAPATATPAIVQTTLFGPAKVNEVELTVRVPVAGDNTYFELAQLELVTTEGIYALVVAINKNVTFAENLGGSEGILASVAIDTSKETHIAFRLDGTAVPWKLSMRVNDAVLVDQAAARAPSEAIPESARLAYGAIYSVESSEKRVVIDNVVFDRHD